MKNSYRKISSLIYNYTKPPNTSVDGDIQFYKELLIPIDGKVLEAGVGNGRMLISLLKYKVDIMGIDKSQDMIDLCKQNLKENNLECELICEDLVNFQRKDYFDYIIMPNASFNLIETRQEAIKILENFYNSLKKDGILVIDLILPTDFKVGSLYEYSYTINNQKIDVKNYAKKIDWVEQYTLNEISYFIDNKLEEKQDFKLTWYGINEFNDILTKIRYKPENILLNYNSKIKMNVKTITFVFRK